MPRRTPDQGVKPFEFRTGVGGLPPLGGIFRAGDPATIPPHKHHMVINARITPSGLYSRPGLTEEFNTNVEECIEGITSVIGGGAGFLAWPAAWPVGGNGIAGYLPVPFRAIYPDGANGSSEWVVVEEPQEFATGMDLRRADWSRPSSAAEPFIHNGSFHFFYHGTGVTQAGQAHPTAVDLYRAPMPDRAFTPAAPLVGGAYPNDIASPGAWRGYPYSSPQKLVTISDPFGDGRSFYLEQSISVPERIDQPLGGELVGSVLYILISGYGIGGAATIKKTLLLRWDGVSLSTEALSVPDHDTADAAYYTWMLATGNGSGICIYKGGDVTNMSGMCWIRDEDGAWQTVDPLEDGLSAELPFYPFWGFTWAGVVHFVGFSPDPFFVAPGGSAVGAALVLIKQVGDHFEPVFDFSAVYGEVGADYGAGVVPELPGAAQVGPSIYLLFTRAASTTPQVVHYDIPSIQVIGAIDPIGLDEDAVNPTGAKWLQAVSGACYCGGKFVWNPVDQQAEPEDTHAVYDVTDTSLPTVVYRKLSSELDADESLGFTYSCGAFPVFPGSDAEGELD